MAPPFYPIGGLQCARMHARVAAVAAGLLTLLLVPAAAEAVPTLEPLKPCYVTARVGPGEAGKQGEPVMLRAVGFTPDSRVTLSTALGAAPFPPTPDLQVNSLGELVVPEFPAPFVGSGTETFTVNLTEQGNPANTVTASAQTSALGVSVKPQQARPSQKIRFKGLGFTADKPVYAHYTHRGKERKRIRLVNRPGTCGAWNVRRPQFPMDSPDQGRWVIQFDQSKRYVNGTTGRLASVFVRLQIDVKLVPR